MVLDSLEGRFDLRGYPTPYSNIAALMVFEHQAHMTNLLTYINWESRVAEAERRGNAAVREAARDLVDYMLFVEEGRLREGLRAPPDSHRCSRRKVHVTLEDDRSGSWISNAA